MSLDTRIEPTSAHTTDHPARYALAAGRLFLGWIFLWAFIDHLFGMGKSTKVGWLDGASPSKGFLSHTEGPFKGILHAMAGAVWADTLFMFGLIGLGVALILGVFIRLAAIGGTILMVTLWIASLWPEYNPFMDEHWVYAAMLVAVALANAGDTFGLGRPWSQSAVVQRYPILR